MSAKKAVPPRLAGWSTANLDRIGALLDQAREINTDDPQTYTLDLISTLAEIETAARRGIYLLTAHAIRTRTATATAVAKASGITITAAQSRAGSALAQEVTSEAWPRGTR